MPITREEYIAQYGIDPEAPTEAPDSGGGVLDHAKGLAVGVATLPTELYSILPVVGYHAIPSLYRSFRDDTKFMDEISKDMQIDEAQNNITTHLQSIKQQWAQRDPSLNDEQLDAGIAEYMKSKQYEDFSREQLRHFPYVASKWKDTVRGLLGDERTEEQRGWSESAAEIVGGALVGGPVGGVARLGMGAARGIAGGAGAAVAGSLPARAVFKAAELVTPATIPYSAGNIALNAGVGVGVDQALRYAQNKDTVFTPKPDEPGEESHNVAKWAGLTALVGGWAAVVGAVKGRSAAALRNMPTSPTSQAIQNDPHLGPALNPSGNMGEAIIRGGAEQELGVPSALDAMNPAVKTQRMLTDQMVDQGYAVRKQVEDLHPNDPDIAATIERSQMNSSHAVMNDTIPSRVSNAMRALQDYFSGLSREESRNLRAAWWLSSDAAQNQIRWRSALARHTELANQLQAPNLSHQARTALRQQLTDHRADMQRFISDVQSARPRIPDIPMATGQQMARRFETDTTPHVVKLRQLIQDLNRANLDRDVATGKLSQADADALHRENPFYVRSETDPLKGKEGVARLWEAATQAVNRRLNRASEGSGVGALHDSPLRHLDKDIPRDKGVGAPETRITHPLDPMSAMRRYVEQSFRDEAKSITKNDVIDRLAWVGVGVNRQATAFHQAGHMRIVQTPGGRDWWTGELLHSAEANAAKRNPNVVDIWRNGEMQLWELGDPIYAAALRNEPSQLTGLMRSVSATTNIMKAMTTGRFAPWFAPLGAAYNTVIGMLTRRPGRAFGPASYLAHRFLPTGVNKYLLDAVPDPSVFVAQPYHLIRGLIELQAYHLTQPIVRQLLQNTPFTALQQAVGAPQFSRMVNTMLKVASWAENSPAATLHRAGATIGHQSIDNLPSVRTAFTAFEERVPTLLKGAWQFYKDTIDAFYLADKRMYYTENYALQHARYRRRNQAVPQHEIDRIVHEARTLAGDMAKVPSGKGAGDLERALPYLTQTKLGAYHLMRNMTDGNTAAYVNARTIGAVNAVAASFYMMTYWDENARKEFWGRTADYQRYKFWYVPKPEVMLDWFKGVNVPYSRDKVYRIPIPPDIAPMVAGTVAFWQMLGAIPADATPKPLSSDVGKVLVDSFTPGMPPALQALLGMSGMRLDPQSSETRGGDWIRSMVPRFKAGPQAESRSNLGEVSTATSLVTSGLFGALGGHLVAGMDVFLHASKFNQASNGVVFPRESKDFAAGLRAATTEVFGQSVSKVPDIPLLWQNKDKYVTSTASWTYMKESDGHINIIKNMGRDMMGKAAQQTQMLSKMSGGMPPQAMTDQVLGQLADDITKWSNPTGELGKLKAHYQQLAKQQQAISAQYNLSQDEKRKRGNMIIKLMQDNMEQQYLATKYAEDLIAQKYGQALAPRLGGRDITMETIEHMMRESLGKINAPTSSPTPQPTE